MKITDIKSRCIKTFFQSFFGVLIPELVIILQDITVITLTWSSLWYLGAPLIAASIAAGLSATWNLVNNWLLEDNEVECEECQIPERHDK